MPPLRLILPFYVTAVIGVLWCTVLATAAAGAELEPQRFPTVEHDGVAILDVPSDWEPVSKLRGRWPARTIIFTDAGNIVFSVMWNKGKNPEYNSTQQLWESLIKAVAENTGREIDDLSDPEILTGPHMNGFFYSNATLVPESSAEMGPEDYKNFTLGIFAIEEFQIFFTMISREESSPDRLRGLEMFRSARFEAGTGTQAAPEAPPAESKQ